MKFSSLLALTLWFFFSPYSYGAPVSIDTSWIVPFDTDVLRVNEDAIALLDLQGSKQPDSVLCQEVFQAHAHLESLGTYANWLWTNFAEESKNKFLTVKNAKGLLEGNFNASLIRTADNPAPMAYNMPLRILGFCTGPSKTDRDPLLKAIGSDLKQLTCKLAQDRVEALRELGAADYEFNAGNTPGKMECGP